MQNTIKTYLEKFSETLFKILSSTEELGFFLHSEDSLFLRFNGSKIRQNTTVSQHEITMTLQTEKKSIQLSFNLSLDFKSILSVVRHCKYRIAQSFHLVNLPFRPSPCIPNNPRSDYTFH